MRSVSDLSVKTLGVTSGCASSLTAALHIEYGMFLFLTGIRTASSACQLSSMHVTSSPSRRSKRGPPNLMRLIPVLEDVERG